MSSTGHPSELESLRSQVAALAHELAEHDRSMEARSRYLGQMVRDLWNIVETVPDLLFTLDTDGHLTYWNRRVEQVTGYAPEELRNKPALTFVPSAEQEQTAAAIQRVFTDGRAELEGHLLTKDGRVIPYHWTGAVLKNVDGRVIGLAGVGRDVSEKRRAELELAKQRRHLVEAQALAHLGSWEWDIGSGAMAWSDEQFRIFGHAPQSMPVTHETFLAALLPDDHDLVLAAVNDALAGRAPYDVECRIVRPSGAIRCIHVRGDVARDAGGRPVSMSGTVLDITERKQAETALRASEERWQLAVRGSNDGIWDWNLRTGEIFFSARWKAMRGYEDHEIPDALDEWRSRIHPDDLDRVLRRLETYLDGTSPEFCEEYRVQRKDGSYLWVLDRGVALRDARGRAIRMAGSATDITDRKLAEQALIQSRDLLTSFMEHAPAAIAMLDKDLRYLAASRRWIEDFRLSSDTSLIGRHHYDVFPEIRAMPEWQAVHRRCLAGAVEHCEEDRFVRADGSEEWIRWEVRPWHDTAGDIGGIIIFTEVITARKRAEQALARSERQLRTVLDALPVGVCFTDATGKVMLSNPASHRLWSGATHVGLQTEGRSAAWREEAPGQATPHRWALARVLTTGEASRDELMEMECADGSRKTISNSAVPVRDEQGRVTGAIVVNEDITERVAAENALRRTHVFLHSIVENIPHMITVKDAKELRYLMLNKAGEQLFGHPREALLGRTAYHVLPEADADRVFAADTEALMQEGAVTLSEQEFVDRHGRRRLLHTKKIPIPGEDGRPAYLLTMSEDITERRAAEEALRASEELFAKAFRASPNPMGITELATGRCIDVNDAGLELFGFRREELVGQSTLLLGIWPDPADRARLIERVQTGGPVRNLEMTFRTRAGEFRHLLISSDLVDLCGTRCLVTVGADITEQKRAEAALRESEARLTEAQRIAHIGSWELNLRENRLTWSDEIFRIFEIDPQRFDASYDAFLALVHPEDRDTVHRVYQESLTRRQPYSLVHRLLMPDGRIKFVREQCETRYDADGRPIRSIGTVQDITEQKRAEGELQRRELELRQAIEERTRISQDLHDGILQSLYAVGLGLESCKPLIAQQKHQEAWAAVELAIARLNGIMTDVRNFIAGLESDVLEGGDLGTAVRTVVQAALQAHAIRCRMTIEQEALGHIPKDQAIQLLHIVREAISNIVRHANATRMSLSIRRRATGIRLRIRDNGVGFDQARAVGTGHGLLNMAARARKLGTDLFVRSAPGVGTTIMLNLPTENVHAHRQG